METTLATILITATVTVAVISLGVIVWAIAQLKHKVSRLEVLCKDFEIQFQGVYNEFGNQSRNHDDSVKELKNEFNFQVEKARSKIDEVQQELHLRIDRDKDDLERILDKRFDSVYRKIYGSKSILESEEKLNG